MNDLHPLTQAIIAGKRKEVPELVNQCLAAFTHVFQDVKGATPKLFRQNSQPKHPDAKQTHRHTRRPGLV